MSELNQLSDTIIEKLKKQILFKELDNNIIKNSITNFEEIYLLQGELAFRKGERYHKGIYFLLEGNILLSRPNSHIKITCINTAVGLSTFLGKTSYTMNATSQSDSYMLFINELCIYRLMELSENFRKKLIKEIQLRLTNLENNSNTFLMQSVSQTVGGVMSSPIISITIGSTVEEAAKLMKENKINSLVVTKNKKPKGIITSNLLTTKFLADFNKNLKKLKVENYMEKSPLTFPPEFPIVEALNKMQISNNTHAIVIENEKPAGIISVHGISLKLFENSHLYSSHIENMKTLSDLKYGFENIYTIAKSLSTYTRISREVITALSAIHSTIHKRVFQITSEEFKKEHNFILSEHPYCYVLLGAGSRKEMDLKPNINHAIIVDDEIKDKDFEMFQKFLHLYNKNLEHVGYCPMINVDNISEDKFVIKLSDWIEEINLWSLRTAKGTYKFSIYNITDIISLEGDISFGRIIKNHIESKANEKTYLADHLFNLYPQIKIPINPYGVFIIEQTGPNKDMINMKNDVLDHIVYITNLLSFYYAINETSTIDRIEHLQRKKIISSELYNQAIFAYDTIIETLINEQINQAINGQKISGYINPTSLSLFYQDKLKKALQFATIYTNYCINIISGK